MATLERAIAIAATAHAGQREAGIQYGVDSLDPRFLDTGFRRCDESYFNKLLDR